MIQLSEVCSVAFITLGCAKNEVDSRLMSSHLEEQGFVVREDLEEADFIILNTCAFIEAAIEESLDTILELAALERVMSGETRLLVVGCLPSRFGEQLEDELPEVSSFIPVSKEDDLALIITQLLEQQPVARQGVLLDTTSRHKTQEKSEPWGYVKISDGCSRHCTYCTIPSIRGPYHSYAYGDISAEIDKLLAKGAREIVLIGQDTGIWSEPTLPGATANGKNPQGTPQNLAELLATLAKRYPKTWFRTLYLQPEGINNDLLEVMAAHDNIADYLDIPLQHASERILKAMNRRGSAEEYLKLLSRIRKALPVVVLRTTVMTGFPSETQEDYDELYEFIRAACFDYVGIFAYSCEEGTLAASMPEQVDEETAFERAQELRDLADSMGFSVAQDQVGTSVDVLVCGKDEEGLFGRTQGQAPDVDGLTYILPHEDEEKSSIKESALTQEQPLENLPELGSIVRVRISEAVLYDLFAEVL